MLRTRRCTAHLSWAEPALVPRLLFQLLWQLLLVRLEYLLKHLWTRKVAQVKALQLLWKLKTSMAAHPSCGLPPGTVQQTRVHQVWELNMSEACGMSFEARNQASSRARLVVAIAVGAPRRLRNALEAVDGAAAAAGAVVPQEGVRPGLRHVHPRVTAVCLCDDRPVVQEHVTF